MKVWNYIEEHHNFILWTALCFILLAVCAPIIRKIRNIRLLRTVSSASRGTKSERDLILKLLKHGIPSQTIFHDLYVKKGNGKFAQIDLVVATREGLIVFEVKDYSGWIYGSGHNTTWTQVLAYGKRKYRFYNPIKQNAEHIHILKKQLAQFTEIPFFSIAIFYGNCELKEITYVPKNTFVTKSHRVLDVLKVIRESNVEAPYTNKKEIVNTLKQAIINGNNKNNIQQHIEDVKDLLGTERIFK